MLRPVGTRLIKSGLLEVIIESGARTLKEAGESLACKVNGRSGRMGEGGESDVR